MKEPHAKTASAAAKQSASSPRFDTMAAVDTLTKADIGQRPASAIVEVVRDAQRELATEASLHSTTAALEAGLREEMAELKAELKTDIRDLDVKMANQFSQLYRYLLIGAGVCVTSLAGIMHL